MTLRRHPALAAALPQRALSPQESRALERAMALALTPQERLEWLEAAVDELSALCGLARVARRQPTRSSPEG